MLKTVKLDLAEKSYDILVGEDLIENAGQYIAKVVSIADVVIVTDKNVAQYHLENLQTSLNKSNLSFNVVILESGERTKRFVEFENLLNQLLSFKPERKVTLIALGGGVIGDITGFAASVLLRGVDFVQIPTTLLAMVDSSVGGKTGINTKYGKNLIGSFHQPRLVLCDISALKTLPNREVLAGYAEVVKYGLINDSEFFSFLEQAEDFSIIYQDIIEKSCKAKAEIVSADEKEKGQRALLNLGHTFGHALESYMKYDGRLLHGEAVAVGMVMAFAFSCHLGICAEKDVIRVKKYLQKVGLPTHPFEIDDEFANDKNIVSALLEFMKQDKKVEKHKLIFILVHSIGDAFIEKSVDEVDLQKFLQEYL